MPISSHLIPIKNETLRSINLLCLAFSLHATDRLSSDTELRSKKELIEKFIEENLPLVSDADNLSDAFDAYWTTEKKKAIKELSQEENLDFQRLVEVISNYLFTQKEPMRDEVIAIMQERPSLKQWASASKRVISKIVNFVETFINGMG